MKLSEFILLNEAEKKCAIMKQAVPLAQRTYSDMVIFLFFFFFFFLVAYCNTADKSIEKYCILPDINAICHYLEAIPIDELLN